MTTDMLWKISSGKIFNCFRGEPKTCKNIDKYSIYGFCYDRDYYGVGIGEEKGPYGYNCSDWVFSKEECYPETCELANVSNRFGWCVDYNRAYRGTSCGPDKSYGIRCKKWIWNDPSKCPKTCPKPVTRILPKCPPKKKIPKCPIVDHIHSLRDKSQTLTSPSQAPEINGTFLLLIVVIQRTESV
jgi:hypothetical protein